MERIWSFKRINKPIASLVETSESLRSPSYMDGNSVGILGYGKENDKR